MSNRASVGCWTFSRRWACAALALILFSTMATACSARMLSLEELSAIFFEDEWLHPSETGVAAEIENPAGSPPAVSSSAGVPGNDADQQESTSTPLAELITATSTPGSDELPATHTPVVGSPSPTTTSTPVPTWTPTGPFSPPSPTPQPSPTATRRLPTATPTVLQPTATSTVLSPTSTGTPQPSATATSAPPTATSESCAFSSNASYETALIALINQERANQGIAALTVSSQLTAAARQHSRDMACNDFFSHTGSDGSSPFSRMASSGFSFSAAAENLFAGSSSAQQAFNAWMNSPGHRTNMLNPTYTHIGVGYIYNASSSYGSYFTADFARP